MFTLKLRRDYANTWSFKNPILADGEPAVERDTGRLKVGNGVTPWNDLPYFYPGSPVSVEGHINDPEPHPVYDDGPSLLLLYQNAKV